MYWTWIKCTVLIFLYIILADGQPVQDSNDENCLKMSPELQEQINNIIEELTKHVNAISAEYDNVDLRLLEITIDRHFPEENQKNTVVQVTVNDCTNGVNQSKFPTDYIKHNNYSFILSENTSTKSNELLENNNEENFDEISDDSNNAKDDNSKENSEVSLDDDDFNEDDLFIDDINPENTKTMGSEVANNIHIDESHVNFDDFNERETNVTNKNANDDIPVKLSFIDFNDIKNAKFDKEFKNMNSTSKEINLIDVDDQIFFRAMKRVRGDRPFVIYERCVQGSEQYWFF